LATIAYGTELDIPVLSLIPIALPAVAESTLRTGRIKAANAAQGV
jgi:hypothetical protein